MHYKTLTLGLIESEPALYRRLRQSRRLTERMESYADELKTSHLAWIERLAQDRSRDDPRSRKSAALELALAELTQRLAREASPTASADGL